MPFTPFHFGPGLAIKALAPRYFSFTVFILVQVLIDLETLYFMLNGAWPIHRFFHTCPGATLIVLAGVLAGRPLCGAGLAMLDGTFELSRYGIRQATRLISPVGAFTGAVAGAYSHVLLDSIMHSDVSPLSPFRQGNELYNALSYAELHLYCALAGIAGAIGMGLWWLAREARSDRRRSATSAGDGRSAVE